MKKIFSFTLYTLIAFLTLLPQSYAGKYSFVTVVTQKMLGAIKDPKDFTTSSYGLILANEQINAEYEASMSALLFTPELYKQYNKTLHHAAQANADERCIDYRVFTGTQNPFNGFWLGKATVNSDKTTIPVYLEMNDPKAPAKTPSLILSLANTDLGWKIDDITYVKTNSTLRAELNSCVEKE